MADWRYFVHRSSDGEPIGELPLFDVSFEDVLSGTATLNGTLGLYDAKATRALTAPWKCELTAVRDVDVSGGSVIGFHGPIVARRRGVGARTVQISAASPHAYFYKRVTESLNQYDQDRFGIVRNLIDDAMAKTGGTLYRLDYSTGLSGVSQAINIGGIDRRRVSLVIEELASEEDGFDFRWDAAWHDLDRRQVQRTLTLGYPEIGVDRSLSRVVEWTGDLVDVTDDEDGMAASNRVHGLGASSGTTRLRSVAASAASIAAGYPLLEDVVDLSDIKNQALLDGMTAHARNVRLPGGRTYTSTHVAGAHLPYGAVDLGDTVTLRLTAGVESLDVTRRVVAIRTTPATDEVTFVYHDPEAA